MAEQMTSSDVSKHLLSESHAEDPPNKKQKLEKNTSKKLEERLNHILSCSVCLDLPTSACMQCCHGHLMCIGCYHHLLADARLKDENDRKQMKRRKRHKNYLFFARDSNSPKRATCPSCRVEISRGNCIRNLAVEKAISELPVRCSSCSSTFPRSLIANHENSECLERLVTCSFKDLGCSWAGPAHELTNHAPVCNHANKSPTDLLKCLEVISNRHTEQVSVLHNIISLLSCEHITYTEVQLRPYRTDDFVTKLFYESNRFHLSGHTWALKAFVSAVERHPSNPTVSAERRLSFQLLLKSKVKITEPLETDVLLLKAPYDEIKIKPKLFYTKFTGDRSDSELQTIESEDVNRIIGSKFINIRLFMFQPKR